MSDEQYEPTFWDRIGPTIYGIAVLVMNVSFAAAGLAALYLLWGIFGGGLSGLEGLPAADKARVFGVVTLAGQVMTVGLALATVCVAYIMIAEEMAGYVILAAAAAIGFGIQFAFQTFGGNVDSEGVKRAFSAFNAASLVPCGIGALLVVRDVIGRFASALKPKKVDREQLTYGTEAMAEARPVRTSVLAKCWEGPYCRDFIRPHCPIFKARQACWRVKRGCYCEEEIVTQAAARVQGVHLEMAPESKYNFANPPAPGAGAGASVVVGPSSVGLSAVGSAAPPPPSVGPGGLGMGVVQIQIGDEAATQVQTGNSFRRQELTPAQKRERCRNCIIYNEHQREKYKILMPIALVGGIVLCAMLSPAMRQAMGTAIGGIDTLISRISFTASTGMGGAPGAPSRFQRPSEAAEWALVGAFSLMLVSKLLQVLEWACFKAKI